MSPDPEEKPVMKSPAPAAAPKRSGFRAILEDLGIALGLGPRTTELETAGMDAGTRLAHERTDLAVERNYLASERTLMGWIRTCLSMISFGFTIGKIGQSLQVVEVKGVFQRLHMVSVEGIAYFLVTLGTWALLAAILQYLRRVAEYRAMGLRRGASVAVIVGLILVFVGAFALTALVIKV